MIVFDKVFTAGELGQKASSEKLHPFPCSVLPSIISTRCFLRTPFVTIAFFKHEGVN